MKKGTLVHIKDEAFMAAGDQRAVDTGGRLWLYVEDMTSVFSGRGDRMRLYRSLATNEEFCWFDGQVEGVPDA